MGTRTMGSHGAGGGNGGIQHPKSDGLSKQGPLYTLTFDEVQHQLGDLGKPLSSMNLDELIKSVWTVEAEANQGMSSTPGAADYPPHTQLASASSIARQSSLVNLSKKTVDELWHDIQKKKNDSVASGSNDNTGNSGYNPEKKTIGEKQPTLGEMTLEDFLAKAGVVAKSSQEKETPASVVGTELITLPQQNINPPQAQWMQQYQIPPIQQQQQHVFMPGHHQIPQPLPSSATAIMDAAFPESQMAMSPSLMGTLSDTQIPGRKRVASGDVMEKTVERRQKRMIKNRESAARSRARKQAYTHELENKVSRLEEENERLRREQEAENLLPCVPPPEPKYQLRRTSSALF